MFLGYNYYKLKPFPENNGSRADAQQMAKLTTLFIGLHHFDTPKIDFT